MDIGFRHQLSPKREWTGIVPCQEQVSLNTGLDVTVEAADARGAPVTEPDILRLPGFAITSYYLLNREVFTYIGDTSRFNDPRLRDMIDMMHRCASHGGK